MMKMIIKPFGQIVLFTCALWGGSVMAVECPRDLPAMPVPFVCNANIDQATIKSSLTNTNLVVDGSGFSTINPLTIDDFGSSYISTYNGILVNAGGATTLTTKGYVRIAPPIRPGTPGSGVPDGILIQNADTATVNLSDNTVIETNQYDTTGTFITFHHGADGVVVGKSFGNRADQITINSQASITTKQPYSNGIIAKYANLIEMNIGGQIKTEATHSPAINSSARGTATNTIILTDANLNTLGDQSVGVVYKSGLPLLSPKGDITAADKNSEITLNNSTITTAGSKAHAIAAGAGGIAGTKNHVTLNNSTLTLTGADANGVYLNTRINDIGGQDTAVVTMTDGSIISSADGIHFVDTTNPDINTLGATHGRVTLHNEARIEATNKAIFTGSGVDIVTIKNKSQVKGLVDGGDDHDDSTDRWTDQLIFDDYSSVSQLSAYSSLVDYKNFERVILQNNTAIQFPAGYNTPSSQTYEIDKTSAVTAHDNATGTTSAYVIKASLTNNGSVDLQDGTNGDTLTVTGNADGGGTFEFDVDTNSGTADTLTVKGNYDGNFIVQPTRVGTGSPDPSKIIDLVKIEGSTGTSATVYLPGNSTTFTDSGVTYQLINDTNAVGDKIWALAALAIELQKTASAISDENNNGIDDAGDMITYSFTVKNTGNVELTVTAVTDPLLSNLSCSGVTLAVGATQVLSCSNNTYTLTATDTAAGQVENQATVTATDSNQNTVTDQSGTDFNNDTPTITSLTATPMYNMIKTVNPTTISAPGTLTYTFTFTNNGNVELRNLTVVDHNIDINSLSCNNDADNDADIDSLAIGQSETCTATRTITQAQINAGTAISNTAVPSAEDSSGNSATEDNDGNPVTSNNDSDNTAITAITSTTITVTTPGTTTNTTPTITGTTNAPVGATVTLTITDSAGTVQMLTATVQSSGIYSTVPTVPLAIGSYEVLAEVSGVNATANGVVIASPNPVPSISSLGLLILFILMMLSAYHYRKKRKVSYI